MFTNFALGQIVATPAALRLLNSLGRRAETFIARHADCDWGDLCEDDKKANDDALKHGGQILSSYRVNSTDKVWVITEGDRSVTTVLTPDDY